MPLVGRKPARGYRRSSLDNVSEAHDSPSTAEGSQADANDSKGRKSPVPSIGKDGLMQTHVESSFRDYESKITMHEIQAFGLTGNPVTLSMSGLVILSLVIVAVTDPKNLFDGAADSKRWITQHFTWLYVGAQNIWLLFIVYLLLSPKYSQLKLGHHHQRPEFEWVTWFMMMFGSAGAGTGLIYYGVAEPIFHLDYNRYAAKGYLSYNEMCQTAINLAYYHWGLRAWMCYTVVGICIGIVSHRMGLPMAPRSCFYPIFGNHIYGWIGDFTDMLSIVTTCFAICTSMGVASQQINVGLSLLNDSIETSLLLQVILIIIITLLASISAHLGLRGGVRYMSISAFICMSALLFAIFLVDHSTFILNFFVQSLGYHMQWFFGLGFHTDAFEQLGDNIDGKAGPEQWMDFWTAFYWGWWVSWSPFVGMFIAKISKGRTIREVILASLTGPVLFTFIWFAAFGGAGLRMEREAITDGCMGRCEFISDGTPFNQAICPSYYRTGTASQRAAWKATFDARRPRGCSSIIQLSARSLQDMWFDVMMQYENVGETLVILSLISMCLFVVTTNDSGAIILDLIGSNGNLVHKTKPVQKQIWSLLLGATTSVLLIAGGNRAISALETVILALGLPYTVIVCFMCISCNVALEMEVHEDTMHYLTVHEGRFSRYSDRNNGNENWHSSILGVMEIMNYILSLGKIPGPKWVEVKDFFIALFFPWYIVARAVHRTSTRHSDRLERLASNFDLFHSTHEHAKGRTWGALAALLFYTTIGLLIAESRVKNMWALGMTCFFLFVCLVAVIRRKVRKTYFLGGALPLDLMASIWYPFALAQILIQIKIAVKAPKQQDSSDMLDAMPSPMPNKPIQQQRTLREVPLTETPIKEENSWAPLLEEDNGDTTFTELKGVDDTPKGKSQLGVPQDDASSPVYRLSASLGYSSPDKPLQSESGSQLVQWHPESPYTHFSPARIDAVHEEPAYIYASGRA